jgi:hypothetical protein
MMFTRKPDQSSGTEPSYGYLTAVQFSGHGYFGGYLIVSSLGRPFEFHCTAPVQPSRAQEILYGPTLQAYLLGEQISYALLNAGKLTPDLILTDQAVMMDVRPRISMPLVHLTGAADEASPSSTGQTFVSGNHELQLLPGYSAEQPMIVKLLEILARHVDLAEPFDRIREAIREAQRIGTRNQEDHGQAA